MSNRKKLLVLGFFIMLALSIPITLSLLKKPQETRTRAAGSTTLSFNPTSSATTPIQKQVGDTISLDMMVDPGTNLVSFVKFQLAFDPTKLALSTTNPFTINPASSLTKVEGPVTTNNNLSESLSIGADPSKAIQIPTKIGTVNFTAIGGTNGAPTTVIFTSVTQALSTGSNDKSYQSVLSSTTPATITIGGNSISPTNPQPTAPGGTTATFDLFLHGIGSSGDNPNPNGSNFSNQFPLHPQRNLDVWLYDSNNKLVSNISGAVNYDAASGTFKGSIDLGANFIQGNYIIKLRTDRYLRKLVPDIQKLTPGQDNPIPAVDLVSGDTNNDNALDILDYNAFLDCGYGAVNPLPVEDANSIFNSKACQAHTPTVNIDINDDGIVDSTDYNLFLREISVQNGA